MARSRGKLLSGNEILPRRTSGSSEIKCDVGDAALLSTQRNARQVSAPRFPLHAWLSFTFTARVFRESEFKRHRRLIYAPFMRRLCAVYAPLYARIGLAILSLSARSPKHTPTTRMTEEPDLSVDMQRIPTTSREVIVHRELD